MNGPTATPSEFYTHRVPAQFNRTFDQTRAAADAGDDNLEALLAEMQTVTTCIAIEVAIEAAIEADVDGIESGSSTDRFFLNVEAGRMQAGAEPVRTPIITLCHDLRAFAVLERESGDSILGFLGALAGMKEEMKLTSRRIQNLTAIDGQLDFMLVGEGSFAITAKFGDPETAEASKCSITLQTEDYHALREGRLEPQAAFLTGKVGIEGDMAMAMRIALAIVSPE